MKTTFTVLSLVAAFAASSCGQDTQATSETDRVTASAAQLSTPTAPSSISMRWPAEGPPLNELFAFDIAIPGSVNTATVDADMPAHGHGMLSKPTTTVTDAGDIHVEGMLFHMPGDWVVTIDCTVDGAPQRHDIPVTIDF